jgi:hypothetical protein
MKNNSNKGIQNNKHYLSRRVGWIVFIFIVGIGGYLTLPSNYYLRRALTHLLPKIDQYPIFENRVVKAGSPRPWELSEAYNTKSIPERYLPRFEYGCLCNHPRQSIAIRAILGRLFPGIA